MYFKEEVSNNIYRFTKDRGDNTLLLPKKIGDRYEVKDIMSDSTGFGLILEAEDTKLFNRKVLVKMNNYKNRVGKYNLDSENEIKNSRKNMKFEKNTVVAVNKMGVPNVPIISNYVEGYSPQIHYPEGIISKEEKGFENYAYDEPYLIMQYIPGKTLSEYMMENIIDKSNPEWIKEVLLIGKRLLKIIKMFDRGRKGYKYVYQDLKPDNLLRTPLGEYYLIDFGSVAFINKHDGKEIRRGIGTQIYMAPELKERSLEFSSKADIYSLGIMMYELLTDIDLSEFLDKKGYLKNLDYSLLNNKSGLKQFIENTTQFNPEDRYEDTNEALGALINVLKKHTVKYNLKSKRIKI